MASQDTDTSLVKMSQEAVVRTLAESVKGLSATFYCGGSIPLDDDTRIRVYFEKVKDDVRTSHTLRLPQQGGDDIQDLTSACEEATFGKAGKDEAVLDPEYRKALKLDPSAFSCSFHPAEHGIINVIQQIMATGDSCVRMELHKLNVYRAGDFFKSHVDTPRSENMFGSLVVCLPSAHQGGNLEISHGKKTVSIDWSEKSADHVQWVALYSDCEHEVKEVLGGYRVTLTYNLYADPLPGPKKNILNLPVVDLRKTVLYKTLVKALGVDSFMYEGGILGLTLQHEYPHVSDTFVRKPESMLKGADAVIFAVAKEIGLETRFVHVYSGESRDGRSYELDTLSSLETSSGYMEEEEYGMDHLRNNFRLSDETDYDDVTWCLHHEKFEDVGKVGAAYGNEPSLEVHYCVAALLLVIPEWGNARGNLLSDAE